MAPLPNQLPDQSHSINVGAVVGGTLGGIILIITLPVVATMVSMYIAGIWTLLRNFRACQEVEIERKKWNQAARRERRLQWGMMERVMKVEEGRSVRETFHDIEQVMQPRLIKFRN
jgi:hypothetical protein